MLLDEAFELWQNGANSHRKLMRESGWSDGLCRELIHLMEDEGMVAKGR